jgi:hypothetical protein
MAAAFGGIAFPLIRRARGPSAQPRPQAATQATTQAAVLVVAGALCVLAVTADAPTFWPLVLFAGAVPCLPLAGAPEGPAALTLAASLLLTTLATHAVFFGEDRYHIVVTPVLALLAASALRPTAPAADRGARGGPARRDHPATKARRNERDEGELTA